MSTTKAITKKKESTKDHLLKEITPLLTAAMATLKEKLGDKKFEKRIKKVAKFLVHGIKPAVVKKKAAKKGLLKKVAKKAILPVAKKKTATKKAAK